MTKHVSLWLGVAAFAVILAMLALPAICEPAPAFDGKAPVHDGQIGSTDVGGGTSLLSMKRVYPFVGATQRIRTAVGLEPEHDLLWVGGVAYSLGAIAPQFQYRWDPNDGPDVHEFELGLRANLRAIF